MFSVIVVSISPSTSGKWFWHLGVLVLNNTTAKDKDTIDNMAAIRNMRAYASDDGKDCVIPPIWTVY
jgi:hypothetical protein